MVSPFDYSCSDRLWEQLLAYVHVCLKTTLPLGKNKCNTADIQQWHILPCVFLIIFPSSIVLIFVFPLLLSCAFRCSLVLSVQILRAWWEHTNHFSHLFRCFHSKKSGGLQRGALIIQAPITHWTRSISMWHNVFKVSPPLYSSSPLLFLFLWSLLYLDKGQNLNSKYLDLITVLQETGLRNKCLERWIQSRIRTTGTASTKNANETWRVKLTKETTCFGFQLGSNVKVHVEKKSQ